jgi:hypothetical protein
MRLNRKTSFTALLVVALVGASPSGRPPAPTHGVTGQPPVLEVALLPDDARRRTRLASVRMIGRWLLGRPFRPRPMRARGQSLHSPPPLRDSYARGPPVEHSSIATILSA